MLFTTYHPRFEHFFFFNLKIPVWWVTLSPISANKKMVSQKVKEFVLRLHSYLVRQSWFSPQIIFFPPEVEIILKMRNGPSYRSL